MTHHLLDRNECLAYCEDHRGEVDLLVARQMAHDSAVKFRFDNDVFPEDFTYLLHELGHDVRRLRDVLPQETADPVVPT